MDEAKCQECGHLIRAKIFHLGNGPWCHCPRNQKDDNVIYTNKGGN